MPLPTFFALDQTLFCGFNQFCTNAPSTDTVFELITQLGNGWIQALLIIPLLIRFDPKTARRHLMALIVTAAIGGAVTAGLKVAINRPRPPQTHIGCIAHTPMGIPHDPSFPSGHTQTAFSTATYLALCYPYLAGPLISAAALVALSRVALGVHYPLDTVAGAWLGFLLAVLGYRINCLRLEKSRGRS